MIETPQEERSLQREAPPGQVFAVVGGVYEDGLSLIFSEGGGESGKHYKCNSSIVFHPGDRVFLAEDSKTYVALFPVGAPLASLTADNALMLNGRTESELSVASAKTAQDAAQLGGKPEADLTVKSARMLNGKLEAELSVKDAKTLGGRAEAALSVSKAKTADTAAKAGSADSAESALSVKNGSLSSQIYFQVQNNNLLQYKVGVYGSWRTLAPQA